MGVKTRHAAVCEAHVEGREFQVHVHVHHYLFRSWREMTDSVAEFARDDAAWCQ